MIDLDEEVTRADLKDCLDSGWTATEIAEELGLASVADVARWCRYHELATPWQAQRATAKERAQALTPKGTHAAYVKAGYSLKGAAKALGVTSYYVKRRLQAWYEISPSAEREDKRALEKSKTCKAREASGAAAKKRAELRQRRQDLAQVALLALANAGAKTADINAIINATWLR